MGDLELRRGRRACPGDRLQAARALSRRLRSGLLAPERLELAVYLGDLAAALALGTSPQEAQALRDWPRTTPRAYRDPRLRPAVDRLAVWLGGLERWGQEAVARALLAVLELWCAADPVPQERPELDQAAASLRTWLEDPAAEVPKAPLRPLRVRWVTLDNGLRRWGERSVLYAQALGADGSPLPALASPWELRAHVGRQLLPWVLRT